MEIILKQWTKNIALLALAFSLSAQGQLVTDRNEAASVNETDVFYIVESDGLTDWKLPFSVLRSELDPGYLINDGSVPLTANWDIGAYTITGTQFVSDIPTGTAPLVVASTTEVANLNSATAGLATTVTTNANLTGHVTSTGNAAILGSFTLAQLNTAISDGSAGAAFDTIYTADDNYGIGTTAVDSITTGDRNIGIGTNALTTNNSGADNIAIGMRALDTQSGNAHRNVAIGTDAGTANITGDDSVYIGFEAGLTGTANGQVNIGPHAGGGNGTDSIAIGHDAGETASSNSNSIMIGKWAGQDADAASQVLIGYQAGISSDGSLNTALGYAAGSGLTSGAANTLLGANAGDNVTTGGENIVIGYLVDAPSATVSRQIQIGSRAAVPTITGSMGTYIDEDVSGLNTTINGSSAMPGASTFLDGGDLILNGGAGATTGIGIGGDLILNGGLKGATGTQGKIVLNDVYNVAAVYTVATLPTPAVGDVARVSDADTPAMGSTVSGGAAAAALVWYNGANWTVIGI